MASSALLPASSSSAPASAAEDIELSPASSPSPLTPPNLLAGSAAASATASKGKCCDPAQPPPPPPFLLPESATLSKIHMAVTATPTRSKNDIFNAPSPLLTPAPKLPSLKPSLPSSNSGSPLPTPMILPSLPSLPPQPVFSAADVGAVQQQGRPAKLRISTDSSASSHASSSASSFWHPPALISPPSSQSAQPPSSDDNKDDRHLAPSRALQGRARSPPASNPDIRIRLILSGQYLLGVGSHSDVYLGSYRFRSNAAPPSSSSSSSSRGGKGGDIAPVGRNRKWHLCAIKRLHPDRESLLLGLDEVFVLRRLGPHPNVVRLIDVRDEVDLVPERGAGGTQLLGTRFLAGRRFVSATAQDGSGASRADAEPGRKDERRAGPPLSAVMQPLPPGTPLDERAVSFSAAASVTPAAMQSLKGTPSRQAHVTGGSAAQRPASTFLAAPPPSHHGRSHIGGHARSTSDTYGDRSPTPPRNINRHGNAETVDVSMGSPSQVPSGDSGAQREGSAGSTGMSMSAGASTSSAPSPDPPRMLLLLELLPHQLSTYARLHPHRVTYAQWRLWASQLLSALAFFHARNLAHADIKKENCMLTDELVLKVGDLGSAQWLDSAASNGPGAAGRDGRGLGTLAYSAPELARSAFGSGFGARGTGFGPAPRGGAGGADTSGGEAKFGVKVDIWSAGAVLYSLAIDQPPFSRARSTIDILTRKRNFFQTEEADRTSRFDVEVGMSSMASMSSSRPASRTSNGHGGGGGGAGPSSAGGTTTPSRHGSLRGRSAVPSREGLYAHALHHQHQQHARVSSENLHLHAAGSPPSGSVEPRQVQMALLGLGAPPALSSSASTSTSALVGGSGSGLSTSMSTPALFYPRRERERDGSADSMDSLASSIQNMDGRSPSALAVAALLSDDGPEEGEGDADADADGDGADAVNGDGDEVMAGTNLHRALPLSSMSSLGLSSSGTALGLGESQSSPLRKGTAALLSHSQARRSPNVMIDGVLIEGGGGGGGLFPTKGVRRVPSTGFRTQHHLHQQPHALGVTTGGGGSSSSSVGGAGGGVTRHHSVKVPSGPVSGSLGAGQATLSSAAAAAHQAVRHRATSVSGHVPATRAVSHASALPPLDVSVGMRASPFYGSSTGGGSGGGMHGSGPAGSGRMMGPESFDYVPPTPIAEASEAESEHREREQLPSASDSCAAPSSLSSFVPAAKAIQQEQPQPCGSPRSPPNSSGGLLSPSPPAPRMMPSYSSLSSASTAPSFFSYPDSLGSERRTFPRGDDDEEEGEEGEAEGGDDEEGEDLRRYSDGCPPIVLPGGGRLPDAARELLRAMLETDPRKRPSAVEALAALERL